MVKSKSDLVNSKKTTQNINKSTPTVKIVNPFDRKINKVKHEVLNRKVRGVATDIGQSRYNAIEKRKKTLLVEMNQQKKTNKFIDSRYGENDPSMSEEDKMLARFQKEKMRNKNLYSLDDNEESHELTHLGQSLGQSLGDGVVAQDDYVASDDEVDEDNEFLSERQRFGGGEDEQNKRETHKSSKEVYQEIIEKSKQGKAERAREKLLKEAFSRELDEEFNLIRGDLVLSNQVKNSPVEDDAFLKFQAESRAAEQKEKDSGSSSKKEKHDDFDELMVQLQGETRARASDRTKTKEEIMKEEMERLQQKEKERLERASGDYVELEKDAQDSDKNLPKRVKDRLKEKDNKPKMLSADSLDDGNEVLNVNGIDTVFYNPQIDSDEEKQSGSDDDDEDEDDDEEDEDEENEEDGEEQDDEEENDSDLEDDEVISGEIEEDEEELEQERLKNKKSKKSEEEPVETIPYTFDVPSSIEELNEWLENRNDEEKQTILSRIRVCNHISIKPQNKEKMKAYLPILYQRFINTATASDEHSVDLKELDSLSTYIFEVSQDVPDISGSSAKELVNNTYKRICKKLEIQSKLNYWPNQSELLLIKLLGNVFPTSDFQHPVCTPAVESLNFYLSHCPIKNINDIASSLFTSNLLFFYLSSSKRYSPEISSLLISLLSTFVNQNQTVNSDQQNKTNNKKLTKQQQQQEKELQSQKSKQNQWATINSNILVPTILLPENYLKLSPSTKSEPISSIEPKKLEFSTLSKSNIQFTNSLKINLLNYLVSFIEKYIKFYSETQFSESLPSLFNTLLSIVNKLDTKLYHKELASKIESLRNTIEKINNEIINNRKPLILLTGKPQQLRQFNPRFNTTSFFNKDPDAERAEAKKKKALIKKETKGAIREITKDNQFIQAEKFKKAQVERAENDKKRKHIMSELQKEQQEGKAYKKMKDRLDGRI
ncbi:hypothetical protein DICPUDRAFT_148604 [Dictyostelium purpureum]|uniref:Nop14-like protein n=1 Tax=Dictyostelium purpureum TaxID=5786 RepID=F0ZBJ6_DICPU|nr:uncharacterized protein DICPUDRAFT_148604 [Dictyostelium purpureum]EGC38706.1 hypothetical protein DICPUDRAFT_148604 [Dictyostelium purpureum]|eukprot:XP_003284802.1 hypothetical protein DICPUDRAFT_148604 [Dictyostelium purpureum]